MSVNSVSSMKRVTGLVSGLDTDALVKQMVSAQQAKLDKANQNKQLINWQKEAYASVVTQVTDFQSKFLDILNPNSILRTSAFKSVTASVPQSASKYVSVSASSESMPYGFTIDSISQLATAQKIESTEAFSSPLTMSISESSLASVVGKTLTFTLDGVSKDITLENDISKYQNELNMFDISKFTQDLNDKLSSAFGSEKGVPKLSFDTPLANNDYSYTLSLSTTGGSTVKIVAGTELATAMQFTNGQTNAMDTDKTIGELFKGKNLTNGNVRFSINGAEFTFSQNVKMKDVISTINSSAAGVKMSYSSIDDKFAIVSTALGSGENIVMKDLNSLDAAGNETSVGTNFLSTVFGTNSNGKIGISTEGQNAVLKINGKEIIRSENTFTVDGVKMELLAPTDANAGNIQVTGGIDATQAVNVVKEFVEGYNELIESLNSILTEEKQKGYLPLTDAQKSEMSDKQIEQWEGAAKKGILRGDSAISKMISDMRTALVSTLSGTDNNKYSLSSMGISMSSFTSGKTNGTLVIDEAKLQAAIESDPDSVIKLFTQASDIPRGATFSASYASDTIKSQSDLNKSRFNASGLAQRLSDIFYSSVNISTSEKYMGSLIRIAGTGGKNAAVDYMTSLDKKLNSLNTSITSLQQKLYDAEDRAYAKFTSLETALSKLNSQSSYLFNQS